ncbi:MAG: HAD-IIA family hydrolase [Oscillospiraceae bacterium]|jgi:HAD superfamily hydrolase (TIGR01450 family)|nr:HAD-IIA family hydrolase [Oscillospiraceae bacterium]
MHEIFAKARHVILDMDGTFYLEDTMIPGGDRFINALTQRGIGHLFFTNNSANSAALCSAKLAKMNFPTPEEKIVLSSHVAAEFLQRTHPGARIYCLGNERLHADLRAAGVNLVDDAPDVILLGFDTTLTYEKIHKAANWLAAGLPYYATHPDVNCPLKVGFMPDTGSMIALFEASTGRRPTVLGKPTRHTVDYLARYLNCDPSELVFIGDRTETDVAIGFNHGIPSILVLSGATSREKYESQSEIKAGLVVDKLADLVAYL